MNTDQKKALLSCKPVSKSLLEINFCFQGPIFTRMKKLVYSVTVFLFVSIKVVPGGVFS